MVKLMKPVYTKLFQCAYVKEYIRKMERTLSVNYPVLRQNKRVLLNTFVKNHCLKSH